MGIFKPCDIRGVYPDELDEATAELIGRAVATQLGGGRCVLAGDVRLSTPQLMDAVRRGLVTSGAHVLDVGIAPTPVAYWAKRRLEADGLVVVTASHNPPQYNGLKLMLGDLPVSPEGVDRVRRLVDGRQFRSARGSVEALDLRADYLSWLADAFAGSGSGLRVLLDAGNGTASRWAPEAFRRAGYRVDLLFCEPDGAFPNRSPNPSSAPALTAASERVTKSAVDFAACFDGDADRVVFLDHQSRFVPAEQALILLARDALAGTPGAPVVYDLKCTRTVPQEIQRCGGRPVRERSGHAFIKRRLIEEDAVLAGEASGHFFFRELAGDDGIYAALRMGRIVASSGQSLTDLLSTIPPYFISDDIRLPSDDPHGAVDRLRRAFSDLPQDDTDGVCIEFDGGWALCRPSVTEPAITLRVEGDSPQRMDAIKSAVLDALGRADAPPTSA